MSFRISSIGRNDSFDAPYLELSLNTTQVEEKVLENTVSMLLIWSFL